MHRVFDLEMYSLIHFVMYNSIILTYYKRSRIEHKNIRSAPDHHEDTGLPFQKVKSLQNEPKQ